MRFTSRGEDPAVTTIGTIGIAMAIIGYVANIWWLFVLSLPIILIALGKDLFSSF